MLKAAVAIAGVALAVSIAQAQTPAPTPAPSPAPTTWKQVYENSQTVYYAETAGAQPTGQFLARALMAYKVPQVVDGVQIWSVVSRMTLSCDQRRMITVDNTLYAKPMGEGPVVAAQAVDDSWHEPVPGSLGGLVWARACGAK